MVRKFMAQFILLAAVLFLLLPLLLLRLGGPRIGWRGVVDVCLLEAICDEQL